MALDAAWLRYVDSEVRANVRSAAIRAVFHGERHRSCLANLRLTQRRQEPLFSCAQRFRSLVTMSAGGWAALINLYGADAAFGVAFVAANPELAIAIVAIIAAVAGYLAVVC